jgi:olefin beta-lactone synthetase
MPVNISNYLAKQVLTSPESNALLATSVLDGKMTELTYAELQRLADCYANGFLKQGIRKGHKVVILVPLSVDLYAIMIALFKIGAAGVMYEPKDIKWQLKATLENIEVDASITTPSINMFVWSVASYRRIPNRFLTRQSLLARLGGKPISLDNDKHVKAVDLPASAPALINFTSGSEGIPKGICRTHGFLQKQHEILQRHMLLSPKDVILTSLPVFVLSMLAAGAFAIIPPLKSGLPWKPFAKYALQLIREKKVSMLLGSSAFISPLVAYAEKKKIVFKTVQRAMVGGCFLEIDLINSLKAVLPANVNIEVIYGSTEVEPVAVSKLSSVNDLENYSYLGYCVGLPIPEVKVKIIPFTKGRIQKMPKELPTGRIGELIVKGPHVNEKYMPQEPA